MYKIAATQADIPEGGRFIYAGVDGDRVRSDWWLYLLGTAAATLNGTAPWPGPTRPALPTAQTELAATLSYAGLLGRAPGPTEEITAASALAAGGPGEAALRAVCQSLVDSAGDVVGVRCLPQRHSQRLRPSVAEFARDGLQPLALATQMYAGILDRAPDPAGAITRPCRTLQLWPPPIGSDCLQGLTPLLRRSQRIRQRLEQLTWSPARSRTPRASMQ